MWLLFGFPFNPPTKGTKFGGVQKLCDSLAFGVARTNPFQIHGDGAA